MMKINKIILVFILILASSNSFGQNEDRLKLEIGMTAPLTELRLLDVENEYRTIKGEFKVNGIIVVFSCNTCPFVVGSSSFEGWEKDYNELAAFAAKNKMGFVLVNSNQAKRDGVDSHEKMKERASEEEYTMPYLLDPNSTMANAFGAKTTPHVFMFDDKMKLNYSGSIDNSWDSKKQLFIPYLKQAIQQYVKGEVISFLETAPKGCSIKRL